MKDGRQPYGRVGTKNWRRTQTAKLRGTGKSDLLGQSRLGAEIVGIAVLLLLILGCKLFYESRHAAVLGMYRSDLLAISHHVEDNLQKAVEAFSSLSKEENRQLDGLVIDYPNWIRRQGFSTRMSSVGEVGPAEGSCVFSFEERGSSGPSLVYVDGTIVSGGKASEKRVFHAELAEIANLNPASYHPFDAIAVITDTQDPTEVAFWGEERYRLDWARTQNSVESRSSVAPVDPVFEKETVGNRVVHFSAKRMPLSLPGYAVDGNRILAASGVPVSLSAGEASPAPACVESLALAVVGVVSGEQVRREALQIPWLLVLWCSLLLVALAFSVFARRFVPTAGDVCRIRRNGRVLIIASGVSGFLASLSVLFWIQVVEARGYEAIRDELLENSRQRLEHLGAELEGLVKHLDTLESNLGEHLAGRQGDGSSTSPGQPTRTLKRIGESWVQWDPGGQAGGSSCKLKANQLGSQRRTYSRVLVAGADGRILVHGTPCRNFGPLVSGEGVAGRCYFRLSRDGAAPGCRSSQLADSEEASDRRPVWIEPIRSRTMLEPMTAVSRRFDALLEDKAEGGNYSAGEEWSPAVVTALVPLQSLVVDNRRQPGKELVGPGFMVVGAETGAILYHSNASLRAFDNFFDRVERRDSAEMALGKVRAGLDSVEDVLTYEGRRTAMVFARLDPASVEDDAVLNLGHGPWVMIDFQPLEAFDAYLLRVLSAASWTTFLSQLLVVIIWFLLSRPGSYLSGALHWEPAARWIAMAAAALYVALGGVVVLTLGRVLVGLPWTHLWMVGAGLMLSIGLLGAVGAVWIERRDDPGNIASSRVERLARWLKGPLTPGMMAALFCVVVISGSVIVPSFLTDGFASVERFLVDSPRQDRLPLMAVYAEATYDAGRAAVARQWHELPFTPTGNKSSAHLSSILAPYSPVSPLVAWWTGPLRLGALMLAAVLLVGVCRRTLSWLREDVRGKLVKVDEAHLKFWRGAWGSALVVTVIILLTQENAAGMVSALVAASGLFFEVAGRLTEGESST